MNLFSLVKTSHTPMTGEEKARLSAADAWAPMLLPA